MHQYPGCDYKWPSFSLVSVSSGARRVMFLHFSSKTRSLNNIIIRFIFPSSDHLVYIIFSAVFPALPFVLFFSFSPARGTACAFHSIPCKYQGTVPSVDSAAAARQAEHFRAKKKGSDAHVACYFCKYLACFWRGNGEVTRIHRVHCTLHCTMSSCKSSLASRNERLESPLLAPPLPLQKKTDMPPSGTPHKKHNKPIQKVSVSYRG